jgi:hypothetical protein
MRALRLLCGLSDFKASHKLDACNAFDTALAKVRTDSATRPEASAFNLGADELDMHRQHLVHCNPVDDLPCRKYGDLYMDQRGR